MYKFHKLNGISKHIYESVIAGADIQNGRLGTVAGGKFTVAADGTYAVMQIAKGDVTSADFDIAKGEDVRVVELAKVGDEELDVSATSLADSVDVSKLTTASKLASDSEGKLVVSETGKLQFVKAIEFDGKGIVVKVVA